MSAFEVQQKIDLPNIEKPIFSIGAGGIVTDAHLPAYKKAGFRLAGIFDLNEQKAKTVASNFGIAQTHSSLDELLRLAPKNAVFDLAVPAAASLDVLQSLPDGAAVLIQKPMGNNLEQANLIHELATQKRLTAAINFQLRYAPFVLAAKSLIDQGAIGELHDMEIRVSVHTPWELWTFLEALPRMDILYHSIHYLDLIRSFLGEPKSVYAKTLKHPKTPKLASSRSTIILDYGDTTRALISTNHGHDYGPKHQESFIKWEGTKGAIKATMGLLKNYPKGEPDCFQYCLLGKQNPTWQSVNLKGSWFPDAFIGSMSSLMNYKEGSSQTLPTATSDALKTMQLVEAAHNSSDTGGIPVEF